MTEMDITYIFIRYISVSIKRQSKAFYHRYNRIFLNENNRFVENINLEDDTFQLNSYTSNPFYRNTEEKLSYQELLFAGLNSLDNSERQIVYEKFVKHRTDADIGNEYSISSQMVSKRKRKILDKLKIFFST